MELSVDLSYLNGTRVAVQLQTANNRQVLFGTARHLKRNGSSRVLRIELDSVGERDGHPVIFLTEDIWSGSVSPDTEFGCDYRIELNCN